MFYSRKNKNVLKDGIVVVSISNLFHLLDLSRKKETTNSNNQKKDVSFLSAETIRLKDGNNQKGNFQLKKTIKNDLENESKTNEKEKELKIEESKELFNRANSIRKFIKDNNKVDSLKAITFNKTKKFVGNPGRKKSKFCDYFINLVICIFLLLLFNNCFLWIFCYMFSTRKNKTYCFNHHLKEFKQCDNSDFCPSSGNHDFIYINEDNLSDVDIKNEVNNINNNYLKIYNYEVTIFSKVNKKIIKTENTLLKFSITIIFTKNENYLFNNTFRIGCENYLREILIIILIASVIGTFVFGLLADIFGRRKILILVNICEIIGGLSLFFSTYFIQEYNYEDEFKEKFGNDFLNYWVNNINNNESIKYLYLKEYINIKQEVFKTRFINDNFKKFKIFVFGSIFLIFLSNSSIKIISLSYMLENALTNELMSLYYLFFNFSEPLSILLSTILVIYTNSFEYPVLICSLIMLIITIFFAIFFFESQRFNFEYCFYTQITEFAQYILGKEELKELYKKKDDDPKNNLEQMFTEKEKMNYFGILYSIDDYRIQSELNNEKINKNTHFLDAYKFTRNNFYNHLHLDKKVKQFKTNNLIERFKVYGEPTYIIKLILKNKHLQKKYYVTIVFIINLSIVMSLPLQRITTNYLFSREKLITKNVFINYLFLCQLFVFLTLFPFIHYLTKCFGLYSVLFPPLAIIAFSTWFFEISCFFISNNGISDLNKYIAKGNDEILDNGGQYLIPQVFFISISLICLHYSFYFLVIKITKTINRCSILAFAQIIYNFCFLIGIGLEKSISGGYFFSGLFSIIAIINAIFINSSDDSLNISEIREIKYDEKKASDK